MKASVWKVLTWGCALAMIAPLLAFGGDKTAGGGKHGGGALVPVEEALTKLELTEQQKTKIEDCKAKFRDYLKARQEDVKAAKQSDDPGRKKPGAKALAEKRQEMIDGIRAILTDEQKKTFDEALPKPAAHGKGGAKANPKAGGTVTQ